MEKIVIEHFKRKLQKGEYVSEYVSKGKTLPFPNKVDGKLLEVGCGTRFLYEPKKIGIYGIDIVPEMVKLLKKKHSKAYAIIGDVKMLPFRNGVFDIVTSHMLLHHLVGSNPQECKRNIKAAIGNMKYVLKPQGTIIIRDLLARNYFFSLMMFYVTFLCSKFGIEIARARIQSKVIVFYLTEKDFEQISSENGLEIGEKRQIGFKRTKDWIMGVKVGKSKEFLLTHT